VHLNISVRATLIASITLLILVSDVLIGFYSFKDSERQISELFDAQLSQSTRLLAGALTQDYLEWESEGEKSSGPLVYYEFEKTNLINNANKPDSFIPQKFENKIYFQLWSHDKKLKLHSKNSPIYAYAPWEKGFHTITIDNEKWRAFTVYLENSNHWLISAEKYEIRSDLIKKVSTRIFIIQSFLTPIILILGFLIIHYSFKRIGKISHEIEARNPRDLSPIKIKKTPYEISSLVNALNSLLGKLRKSQSFQEEFTSNAAHELRTPLSAIKLHAQTLKYADSIHEAKEAALSIDKGVNDCIALVEKLLEIARQDIKQYKYSMVDVNKVILEHISRFRDQFSDKSINIESKLSDNCMVFGDSESLSILFRNLIENAFKYTPNNGRIYIETTMKEFAMIKIEDSGPGIKPSERNKVFRRFHRSDNVNKIEGTGLGMSIVKAIMDNHEGKIELTESKSLGGALIKIKLPIKYNSELS